MKDVMSFGKKNKLNPGFIGPFEILERIGPVAYRLALPPSLSKVLDVFHFSRLRMFQTSHMSWSIFLIRFKRTYHMKKFRSRY